LRQGHPSRHILTFFPGLSAGGASGVFLLHRSAERRSAAGRREPGGAHHAASLERRDEGGVGGSYHKVYGLRPCQGNIFPKQMVIFFGQKGCELIDVDG